MNYTVTGSRVAYDGKIMKVAVDDITYEGSGRKSKREVVVKEPFVIVIPVMPDGTLLLVRQFRHPFQAMTSTFPAGNVDAGEAPGAAALRELEEEAGYRAGTLTKLCVLHEVPEFARSVGHVFVAEDLTRVPTRREDGEATMSVERHAPDAIRRKLVSGEQKSVTMIAAFFHFEAYQRRRSGSALGLAHGGVLAAAVAAIAAAGIARFARTRG